MPDLDVDTLKQKWKTIRQAERLKSRERRPGVNRLDGQWAQWLIGLMVDWLDGRWAQYRHSELLMTD